MRILVVEDDSLISENLRELFTGFSYAVDTAADGSSCLAKTADNDYDLIILDWMLPDTDGPSICASLRSSGTNCPILMLTARTEVDDIVTGLNSGADDYLTKPFDLSVLLARVRSLLRRPPPAVPEPVINISDLAIDTNTRSVTRAGRAVTLSPKEYALLEYLARHRGLALDRLTLLSHVWDENADQFSNTVDVHIRYLRSKIDDGHRIRLIHTVKGKGYMLHAPD